MSFDPTRDQCHNVTRIILRALHISFDIKANTKKANIKKALP